MITANPSYVIFLFLAWTISCFFWVHRAWCIQPCQCYYLSSLSLFLSHRNFTFEVYPSRSLVERLNKSACILKFMNIFIISFSKSPSFPHTLFYFLLLPFSGKYKKLNLIINTVNVVGFGRKKCKHPKWEIMWSCHFAVHCVASPLSFSKYTLNVYNILSHFTFT